MSTRILLPALFLFVSAVSVCSVEQTKTARRNLDSYFIAVAKNTSGDSAQHDSPASDEEIIEHKRSPVSCQAAP